MPTADPSDENSVLIKKLKHACSTYDTAAKRYLAAVKELDSAMESIAIAIRELAQGEDNVELRDKADKLCTSVDKHMAGRGVSGTYSKSRRTSKEASAMSISEDDYTFVTYMNDFTREISVAIDELKETVKTADKAKTKHDELAHKYNKRRMEASEMETKLAKKNQGVANNPKFAKKVADRDAAKKTLDAETDKYNAVYNNLLKKRSETLQRVVTGLNRYSAKYYKSLAATISS